jgi:hypoxanthine phosphoribosyltransferase
MDQPRQELISWEEVGKLVFHLIDQFQTEFEAIIMISPSGVIPAGMLASAMGLRELLLAQVEFPPDPNQEKSKLLTWPDFILFPDEDSLTDRHILVVNNAWGSGRSTRAVQKQVEISGGIPSTCVLHFNPYRNLLKCKPDFYGAITDAYIIYPWEIDPEGPQRLLLGNGGRG